MDQRHSEYIDYYRARLKKYEGNPTYPHSAAAEKEMFEAISTASDLEEFGEIVHGQKLPLKCAIALVRDTYTAWAKLYEELEETVRLQPNLVILKNLDEMEFDTVMDLNTMVTDVETKWQLRISEDETLRVEVWGDLKIIEDTVEDEVAEVPGTWAEERRQSVANELRRGSEHWNQHTIPEAKKFFPDFQPDWETLWESRHRRVMPIPDESLRRRIADHRRRVGVE
jgi:hypothetical protein